MNILLEHGDILQNIEATVIAFCQENTSIQDAQVLLVYEKLLNLFDRRKRKLPELPVRLPPPVLELYIEVKAVCESRTIGSPDELIEADNVAPGVMVMCLKKLINSVKLWTKKDGPRGYIRFVGQYSG